MSAPQISELHQTYLNPVHNRSCPDPFVLKYCGEYWAYCTGFWHDGRCFGVLHSRDLVNWREFAGALEPLPGGAPCYWAPEVVYENGKFLMYYSVGNEARMEIRVAVADQPDGPFVDSGHRLTTEEFAIDAHVFVDADGTRHLFYATDFLTHSHIGTGTVRNRMLNPWTLAGEPRPVTRARFDWQVYDAQRAEKGGVRWHTVEGPTVLRRKRLYYQMFSGGNWQNTTYGVSYATSDDLETPNEWSQICDGERVLPILRTLPGKVIGPGHNSVVRGPDNRQLFCVYHRWAEDSAARVLAIDRLDWVGERMTVFGPSTTPQPIPTAPTFADYFDDKRSSGLGQNWDCIGGNWAVIKGAAVQSSMEAGAEAVSAVQATSFLVEVSLRAIAGVEPTGGFGVDLKSDSGERVLQYRINGKKQVHIAGTVVNDCPAVLDLPDDFDPHAYHLLRVEADTHRMSVLLDGRHVYTQLGVDSRAPVRVALCANRTSAAFKGFELTVGWEDLFVESVSDPVQLGWATGRSHGAWKIKDHELTFDAGPGERGIITKGPLLESYELVVNARLTHLLDGDGCYGIYPALDSEGNGALLSLHRNESHWVLCWCEPAESRTFALPAAFDPFINQQFRFRKQDGRLVIRLESEVLGEVAVPADATRIGLHAEGAGVAFEMARVTAV